MKTILMHGAKAAQVFVVTLIVVILLHIVQDITVETTRLVVSKPTQSRPAWDPASRSLMFLPDGTLHQIRSIPEPNRPGKVTKEIYDANNILIPSRSVPDMPDPPYLSFARRGNTAFNRRVFNSRQTITSSFSKTLDLPVSENGTLREIWRYDRSGQIFVGYDRAGLVLGYLGAQGLAQRRPDAEKLGHLQTFESGWSADKDEVKLLWLTRQALYEINVKARRVDRLVNGKESPLLSMTIQGWYERDRTDRDYVDPNLYRPLIVCYSSRERHLALRDPQQSISFTVPQEWKQWASSGYQFTATREDLFVWRSWAEYRPREPTFPSKAYSRWLQAYRATKKKHHTELHRMDEQGKLEIVNQGSWMETPVHASFPVFGDLAWNTRRLVKCLSPGLYEWIIVASAPSTLETASFGTGQSTPQRTVVTAALKFCPATTWDYLLPSLVMAAAGLWHAWSRRNSRGSQIFWVSFILVFNLAGLLTYFALNHTVLTRCDACGQKRGIEQDACPRCAAPLPVPTPSPAHLIMS